MGHLQSRTKACDQLRPKEQSGPSLCLEAQRQIALLSPKQQDATEGLQLGHGACSERALGCFMESRLEVSVEGPLR